MKPPVLPPAVDAALARLRGAGVRAWLVGGALRDLLRDAPARDFDVVVEGGLEGAARALSSGGAGVRSVSIGGAVPVVLLPGPVRIEITAFRGTARDLEEDLRLRDFTLNAIAFDAEHARFVDPLGGRRDLEERRLRTADPARAFRDDPLRVLRGVRLARELELSVEPQTALAMQRHAWRLGESAGERLREELWRGLRLDDVSRFVHELRACGALAALLPELLRTVGVEQNAHHVDDVFTHTLRVCQLCPPEPVLRLAALLHDIAKPECKQFSQKRGDWSFLRHEHRADEGIERVAARLRLSRATRDRVSRLVRHHLLFPARLETDAALRRMLRRVGGDLIDDLLELRRADYASRGPGGDVPEAWARTEARIRDHGAREAGPRLALTGRDVMRELGLESGEDVGRWLRRLTQRIVERPEENERERLLEWLRSLRAPRSRSEGEEEDA